MKKKIVMVSILAVVLIAFVAGGLLVRDFCIKATTSGVWIKDYKYVFHNEDKTAEVLEYRGASTVITLPEEIFGYKIPEVYISNMYSFDQFSSNCEIEKIIIPKGVGSVRIDNASSLKELEFEEGTEMISVSIGQCNNLVSVIIPESVVCMKPFDIMDCYKLEDIKFPHSLKYITFYGLEHSPFNDKHKNDKYYLVGDGIMLFTNISGDEIIVPIGVKQIPTFGLNTYDDNEKRTLYVSDSVNCMAFIDLPFEGISYFGDENIDFGEEPVTGTDNYTGTIVAPAGSYMEQFCKENNLNFRVMTEEEEATWREKTEAAASEITYQE